MAMGIVRDDGTFTRIYNMMTPVRRSVWENQFEQLPDSYFQRWHVRDPLYDMEQRLCVVLSDFFCRRNQSHASFRSWPGEL